MSTENVEKNYINDFWLHIPHCNQPLNMVFIAADSLYLFNNLSDCINR